MVLVSSFCFLRTRWDTAVMELPSPNYSSLSSYVQIAACEENGALLKRLLSIHIAFSSFLRRHLFKSVTPNFITNSSIPMLSSSPSVHPSTHAFMYLYSYKVFRKWSRLLAHHVGQTRRNCPVMAFRLIHIFGGKRNESWMGCGNSAFCS